MIKLVNKRYNSYRVDVGDTIRKDGCRGFVISNIMGFGDISSPTWIRFSNFNGKYKKYSDLPHYEANHSKVVLIEKICSNFTFLKRDDEYLKVF